MYLKVYYDQNHKIADPEDVRNVLSEENGISVDTDLGYPCVEFPRGAPYSDLERVRKALQNAGFETE